MKKRALNNVIAKRKAIRDAQKTAAAKAQAKAFAVPEISAAQAEYTAARFDALSKGKLLNCKEVSAKKSAYLSALKKHGYSEDEFSVTAKCPVCNDLGVVDGRVCACAKSEFILELARICEIDRRAPFAFSDSDFSKANGEQRDALEKLYSAMSSYVDKFPDVKYQILTFSGNTGTGKSCLASAMVRKAVLEKGESALLMSAYELNSTFLKCHTSPLAERENVLHDVMTADFLVIDDLGTEPMLKNVTVEYLQLLLEERTRSGLCTIVTTNLNATQLYDRYGERIFSRLSDKAHSVMRRIPGKDLRISG